MWSLGQRNIHGSVAVTDPERKRGGLHLSLAGYSTIQAGEKSRIERNDSAGNVITI